MAVAAVSLVAVPAAFAHGGDPTRIHACVIPPQNAVIIAYAPGIGGDPDFDCGTRTNQGHQWMNLDWPSILSGGGGGGPTRPTGPRDQLGRGPTGPSRRWHGSDWPHWSEGRRGRREREPPVPQELQELRADRGDWPHWTDRGDGGRDRRTARS